jgi:hypothetical protein
MAEPGLQAELLTQVPPAHDSHDQPPGMPAQTPVQQAGAAHRSSARQANRGTFQRMLAQRQQEESEYAAFERAAEARMKHGKRPWASSCAPPQQLSVLPAAAATGSTAGTDGSVAVKKRRGRPPKPRPPEAPKQALMGEQMCIPCDCCYTLCIL